ncbi:MAG: hypothetical protein H6811_05010 [Phycisphaeraceae bacterium]|nr:hypothetical protein [Phycisphaeraceae bacterium]
MASGLIVLAAFGLLYVLIGSPTDGWNLPFRWWGAWGSRSCQVWAPAW